MKIYVVVRYTDVSVFGMCGYTEYVTETEMIASYSTKQDANFECNCLNRTRTSEDDNVLYDVIELELY